MIISFIEYTSNTITVLEWFLISKLHTYSLGDGKRGEFSLLLNSEITPGFTAIVG